MLHSGAAFRQGRWAMHAVGHGTACSILLVPDRTVTRCPASRPSKPRGLMMAFFHPDRLRPRAAKNGDDQRRHRHQECPDHSRLLPPAGRYARPVALPSVVASVALVRPGQIGVGRWPQARAHSRPATCPEPQARQRLPSSSSDSFVSSARGGDCCCGLDVVPNRLCDLLASTDPASGHWRVRATRRSDPIHSASRFLLPGNGATAPRCRARSPAARAHRTASRCRRTARPIPRRARPSGAC